MIIRSFILQASSVIVGLVTLGGAVRLQAVEAVSQSAITRVE
jgi:hypothetical protein